MTTRILGICTEPDGFSTAVVVENRVASAIEEFKVREHWSPRENTILPKSAIVAALQIAKIDPSKIDVVAFTTGFVSPERIVADIGGLGLNAEARFEQVDHRIAHSAAAFYSSPFDRAAILLLGTGREIGTSCLAIGDGARIEFEEVHNDSSLSELYHQISRALGFNSRTVHKVAWLGASGEPEFLRVFRDVTSPSHGKPLTEGFLRTLNLDRPHNVAASLQALTNERVIQMAEDVQRR